VEPDDRVSDLETRRRREEERECWSRDECLNTSWFMSLEDARRIVEEWRLDYNQVRPHSSLGGKTPVEYAAAASGAEETAA